MERTWKLLTNLDTQMDNEAEARVILDHNLARYIYIYIGERKLAYH